MSFGPGKETVGGLAFGRSKEGSQCSMKTRTKPARGRVTFPRHPRQIMPRAPSRLRRPSSPPPIFHPLAYRGVVANWPVEWRERWGRCANALEEGGLSWRDAETQAFVEVWNQIRNQTPEPKGDKPAATAQHN